MRPSSTLSPPPPPAAVDFFARGVVVVERGLRGFLGVEILSLSSVEVVAKEEDLDIALPRGGAAGRCPDSTSARSFAASFLMIRKRPSIAS